MKITLYTKLALASTFLLFMAAGCKEYKYVVEMEPADRGLERKLTCIGDFNSIDLDRIAALYPVRLGTNSFIGTFTKETPNDIGGAGFYSNISTEMGTAYLYSERFRGQDDLIGNIETIKEKVDSLVDFLCGWLDYEFGSDPNMAKLCNFCRNGLKHDAENLVLYFWLGEIVEPNSVTYDELPMHCMQYLLERDCFDSSDVQPLLPRGGNISKEQTLGLIRKVLSKKVGYSDPNSAASFLNIISDEQKIENSLQNYFVTTADCERLWQAKRKKENDPNASPPEVADLFSEKFNFHFTLWPPKHTVEVRIKCHSEPFYTNGSWDAKTAEALWVLDLTHRAFIPEFLYCSWSQPNEDFQREHFGKIVLAGENLASYCSWRENLSKDKARQWSTFVRQLNPSNGLEEKIRRFRFSEKQQATDSNSDQYVRDLLLSGLRQNKEQE